MLVNSREVEIEWGDCDAAGIVFYPRYFAMFDASTAYLFARAAGMKKIAWREKYGIIGIPMVDTSAKFLVPSRYGDVIRIETCAPAVRRSSFDIEHKVYRGDVLSIEARETRVWAAPDPENPGRIKGVPIPDEIRRALEGEGVSSRSRPKSAFYVAPSVLPDISPTRGEIGWGAEAAQSPPCGGDVRQDRGGNVE